MKKIALAAALLTASLSVVQAQTTLTGWTFDNNAIGLNASPTPSTGLGTASAVGLGSSSNPDVLSLSGSSTPSLPYSWRIQGTGGNIGWSTTAAIGTQGAQFSGSTAGYYQVQVSFDVYTTTDAEANLMVQYTTEGTIWHNATITSIGSGGSLQNNNNTTNSLVVGSYVSLASGWNNQVVVKLSGISGVDNCAGFAIRIVNAATGTNCLTTSGAVYNNTSGYWVLDNVTIQGISYDTIADWTFDNQSSLKAPVNTPAPAISNNTAYATIMGFNLPNYVFANGVTGSTNYGDITKSGSPYPSTGPAGQYVWRLRGQNPGNGWTTAAGIGTQGGEFDVSTVNYTNIVLTFDLYMTSQGEAKMCVLYTTDGWVTTNIANNIAYGLNPTLIVSNTAANPLDLPGTYFDNTYGSIFFNDLVVDFTGNHAVENNPNFGIRIVNAATGNECVNYLGQPYNNSSGNSRLDNVAFSGQYEGFYSPTLTNAASATVDFPFTNTFAISATDTNWVNNVSSIYVNGVLLTNTAYKFTYSNVVFTPSKSAALQVSGLDYIVVYATNFTSAKVAQVVATGAAKSLAYTQPAGPAASGGTLTINPMVLVTDQYGNGTTNPYAAMVVTATVSNSTAWTLGGSTVQPILNGACTFTDLTATLTGPATVPNAAIQFNVTGYTNAVTHLTTTNFYSTSFSIGPTPAAFTQGNLAVMQIDTVSNNTTFSIIEVNPANTGQTAPLNIVPISATGTNALRMSPSGSGGHLALSDDGTFLCFAAYRDGSSATPDETFNLNRGVGIISNNLAFGAPFSYVSTSYGGSQARAACSPDNVHFLVDDKGGLYVNSTFPVYQQNDISVRSFAGTAYALTAKVAFPPTPSFYSFVNGGAYSLPPNVIDWSDPTDNGPYVGSQTPPPDSVAQDFYMVATNIVYIADQSGGNGLTNGVINKWFLLGDGITWTNIGSWTNADNCDTLFAATNGSGGVYLFYANNTGGQSGNQIVRLTDQTLAGPLTLTSTNIIYTAPSGTSVEGITFTPNVAPYTNWPTPAPILTAQTPAFIGSPFAVTTTPDDATWRASITNITVNGTSLVSSAYSTTSTGEIVFNPANSALLQTTGSKTLVFQAAGYSTVSTVQVISPVLKVGSSTLLSGGYLKLAFTNSTGLSFSVRGTNVLAAPVSTWPVLGHPLESPAGSGIYLFTNAPAGTNNALFELISQP